MPHTNRRHHFFFGICFVSIFISGCAPAFRANPFLNERIRYAQTISVMPIEVEVYTVSAGGVPELVDEYSQEAKNNIKYALNQRLYKTGRYQLKYIAETKDMEDSAIKQLLKDTIALYKAVDTSIIAHTYTSYYSPSPLQGIFPDKIKNFDYSLGPQIRPIADYTKADLLLFLRGGDYLSSGGRIALMVWATVLGFTPTSAGPPHLSVALVEPKTGNVLWYNYFCPQSGYNFRNDDSVKNFIEILLDEFPLK